jgi:hypothetical protein
MFNIIRDSSHLLRGCRMRQSRARFGLVHGIDLVLRSKIPHCKRPLKYVGLIVASGERLIYRAAFPSTRLFESRPTEQIAGLYIVRGASARNRPGSQNAEDLKDIKGFSRTLGAPGRSVIAEDLCFPRISPTLPLQNGLTAPRVRENP